MECRSRQRGRSERTLLNDVRGKILFERRNQDQLYGKAACRSYRQRELQREHDMDPRPVVRRSVNVQGRFPHHAQLPYADAQRQRFVGRLIYRTADFLQRRHDLEQPVIFLIRRRRNEQRGAVDRIVLQQPAYRSGAIVRLFRQNSFLLQGIRRNRIHQFKPRYQLHQLRSRADVMNERNPALRENHRRRKVTPKNPPELRGIFALSPNR